jgi:hypothetical protein
MAACASSKVEYSTMLLEEDGQGCTQGRIQRHPLHIATRVLPLPAALGAPVGERHDGRILHDASRVHVHSKLLQEKTRRTKKRFAEAEILLGSAGVLPAPRLSGPKGGCERRLGLVPEAQFLHHQAENR